MNRTDMFEVKRMIGADFFKESQTPCIFIMGQREVGKSTMVRDLLFHYEGANLAKGVVVPTSRDCDIFKNYNREYDFHRTILGPDGSPIERAQESFLVFDDPADPPFNRYTSDGSFHHAFEAVIPKILFIKVMQYPYHLCLPARDNIDFICIFKGRSLNSTYVMSLYVRYLSAVFPTMDSFYDTLAELAKNPYECIVVKIRNRPSLHLCDNIFLYKSELHPIYDYAGLRAKMDVHREALAATVFHPRRLARWLDGGGANGEDWDS
jgi:hypothetical protein